MAKHAVPKKKQSSSRSGSRYHTFENKTRLRLANSIQTIICPQCGADVRIHRACTKCGYYHSKKGTASKVEASAPEKAATAAPKKAAKAKKVTTIKAE